MHILLVGGAGFVGSHVAKSLVDDDYDVSILDCFKQYYYNFSDKIYNYNLKYRFGDLLFGIRILRCDVTNYIETKEAIESLNPDCIINFAALPLADLARKYREEVFDTILNGTRNLLEIIKDFSDKKKFVYISSSMIYGDFEKTYVSEDCKKNPKDIYGSIKLCGELLTRSYWKTYNDKFNYAIIRPSAIYGPGDNNQRVVGKFLTKAINGEIINVLNPEETFLDFSYVKDVAEGIKLIAVDNNQGFGEFNITRGKCESLKTLVDIIKKRYPNVKINFDKREDDWRPKRGGLNIERAKNLLGYAPKYNLEDGIKEYADYLEKANRHV